MDIIAHTMEYIGEEINSHIPEIRKYRDSDYNTYKDIYNDCFADMRRALGLEPINCCDTRQGLLNKSESIFVLEINDELVDSVAVYGNEIDDLIVSRIYQRKGYGQRLLRYAVARMQRQSVSPIILHVADWNRGAIEMYIKNGFQIIKTETV